MASPVSSMKPFWEPLTAKSTPHSSMRKSMLAIELTPSTMSNAGWPVASSAARTAATSLVTPVADLAVRYGAGDWPDVEAIHLMNNEVFPVCAPSYLEGREPLRTPEDLLNETLLHLVEHDHNWVRWDSWLKALGVDGRLADDFLARGSLVRPLDATLSSERGFYLLTPKDVPLGKSARLFRDWILAEAKGEVVTNAAPEAQMTRGVPP